MTTPLHRMGALRAADDRFYQAYRAANPGPRTKPYTAAELAERLGVSKMTVYREMDRGALQAIRIGRSRRVTVQALAEYEAKAYGL